MSVTMTKQEKNEYLKAPYVEWDNFREFVLMDLARLAPALEQNLFGEERTIRKARKVAELAGNLQCEIEQRLMVDGKYPEGGGYTSVCLSSLKVLWRACRTVLRALRPYGVHDDFLSVMEKLNWVMEKARKSRISSESEGIVFVVNKAHSFIDYDRYTFSYLWTFNLPFRHE